MGAESRSVLRSILSRWWPELVVGVLAGFIFLGFLGSLELWGKREQRAAAETLDTVENGHWLVAQIQGRPRLEKPPLPRWTTALLMTPRAGATSGPSDCRAQCQAWPRSCLFTCWEPGSAAAGWHWQPAWPFPPCGCSSPSSARRVTMGR